MQARSRITFPNLAIFISAISIPLILNIRSLDMPAPNEGPKWGLFVLSAFLLSIVWFSKKLFFWTSPAKPLKPGLSALALALFLTGLAAGVIYTPNQGEGLNRLCFWLAAAITAFFVSSECRSGSRIIPPLQYGIAAGALTLSLFFWLDLYLGYGNQTQNHSVFFSRIGHFNFTADTLITLIPLLGWIALTNQGLLLRLACIATLISSLFMMVASGSLGGLGGLLGGLTFSLALSLRFFWSGKRQTTEAPSKKILITLAISVLLSPIPWKAYNTLPSDLKQGLFSRAAWESAPKPNDLSTAKSLPPLYPLWADLAPLVGARTAMWASTAGMISDAPWLGHGTGSFLYVYPAYSERYDLFSDFETFGIQIKTNPHNLFLQIAAENGIPLALLFLMLFGWLIFRVSRQHVIEPSPLWFFGIWLLVAQALDAQVNHVFFNPASLFMAALAAGLLHGHLPPESERLRVPLPKTRWAGKLLSLSAICALTLLMSFPMRWLVSEWYVAEAHRLGTQNPPPSQRQVLLAWIKARQWSPTNASALFGLANMTYQEGHYGNAERYLKAFLALAPYHTVGLNMLANIQAKTHRLDEAEKTLEKALTLEPSATAIRENLDQVQSAIRAK